MRKLWKPAPAPSAPPSQSPSPYLFCPKALCYLSISPIWKYFCAATRGFVLEKVFFETRTRIAKTREVLKTSRLKSPIWTVIVNSVTRVMFHSFKFNETLSRYMIRLWWPWYVSGTTLYKFNVEIFCKRCGERIRVTAVFNVSSQCLQISFPSSVPRFGLDCTPPELTHTRNSHLSPRLVIGWNCSGTNVKPAL